MRKIREVLRLKYELGLTHRTIAKALRVAVGTVSEYLAKAKKGGLSWPLPEELSDGELEAGLFPPPGSSGARPGLDYAHIHEELRRHRELTLLQLWVEYAENKPGAYGYSRYCELYGQWKKKLNPTMRSRTRSFPNRTCAILLTYGLFQKGRVLAQDEVGYGKPPTAHRFKKGQSGNPRGRPKGAKSRKPVRPEERLKAIVLEEAYRTITVRDGDRTVTLPTAQVIIRSLAVEAAKGKPRAQRLFTEMLTSIEREKMKICDKFVQVAMDHKIAGEEELKRRERLGITDAEPLLPHPDDIKLDLRAGTARIVGPMTKEENVVYDLWVAQEQELLAKLEKLEEEFKVAKKNAVRKKLRNEIDLTAARLWEVIANPPEQIGIG